MALGEAADVFVKLSVGDGLVTQIPALIVSLAAGLLVSKGGTRGSTDKAVFGQLGAYPRALFVAALLLMFVLALMPGPAVLAVRRCSAAVHGRSIGYIIPLRARAPRSRAADEATRSKQAQTRTRRSATRSRPR